MRRAPLVALLLFACAASRAQEVSDPPHLPSQIGLEWNRTRYSKDALATYDAAARKALRAAVRIETSSGHGSGAFLGLAEGTGIVLSSSHNFFQSKDVYSIRFEVQRLTFGKARIIADFPKYDVVVIAFPVKPEDRPLIADDGLALGFVVRKDVPLTVAGFGVHQFSFGEDADCRTFSGPMQTAFVIEGSHYARGSLVAIGCDLAPGDSGGPVLERSTGELLGLITTIAEPSKKTRLPSDRLREKYQNAGEETLVTELNTMNSIEAIRPLLLQAELPAPVKRLVCPTCGL